VRNNTIYEITNGTGAIAVSYSNVRGGYAGTGNIDADPLFVTGPDGAYYLSQTAAGQGADSPCLNAGSAAAADMCFESDGGPVCLAEFTTRTDQVLDSGTVDMGYHYVAQWYSTPTPAPSPTVTPTTGATATPLPECGNDENTVLLIHSDQPDGSAVFTDSAVGGAAPHAITPAGSVHHEWDRPHFSSTSIQFSGNTYLHIADSDDWTFGSGDFTLDLWVWFSSVKDSTFFSQWADSPSFQLSYYQRVRQSRTGARYRREQPPERLLEPERWAVVSPGVRPQRQRAAVLCQRRADRGRARHDRSRAAEWPNAVDDWRRIRRLGRPQ